MSNVVLVVVDGLNPELVTPALMPRLCALRDEGVELANHRPVFPSVTRLNAASMVTGCFPGTHGLHGNLSLVPEYHPSEPMEALEPQLSELRERTGRVLLVPTLSEVLARRGLEYVAAGVGTSGQSFMHHPAGDTQALGATIHTDYAMPRELYRQVVDRFGPWPEKEIPNTPRIRRVTDVLLEYVLAERDPAVATVWFSEPDSSEHATGPHSPQVQQAVRDVDVELGRIIDWLDETGRAATTSVIVTCDHGQATIGETVPLPDLLTAAGFQGPGGPCGVVVAGNGGSALFYVNDHDAETADRLAAWLMSQRWAGPILASDRLGSIAGTLPASALGLEGTRTPDLLMSFAWSDEPNQHGMPGTVYAAGGAPGRGTHGSMSPWEFRTFTVARGPELRQRAVCDTPSGHPDLAPTILRLLGLPVPEQMEGRVIAEAFADRRDPIPPSVQHLEASRATSAGDYHQALELASMPGGLPHLVAASVSRG